MTTEQPSGYTPVSVKADGNCFYRAIARAVHKDEDFHLQIRRSAMDALIESKDYVHLFDNPDAFKRCVAANKRPGVWNTEIADLAPTLIPKLLNVYLTIYDIHDDGMPYCYHYGDSSHTAIALLRTGDCHYDLLVPN